MKAKIRKMNSLASNLQKAKTTGDLLETCRKAVLEPNVHVAVRLDNIYSLISLAKKFEPCGFEWYLSDKNLSREQVFSEYAFNTALNGGYFEIDAETGTIRQWEKDGSGSAALLDWQKQLDAGGLLPVRDFASGREMEKIRDRFAGLPHAETRYRICEIFADPATRERLRLLLDDTRIPGADDEYAFRLEHADFLAHICPEGFGGDPFRKKAILTFLMMAGYLLNRGCKVYYDLPIPSDYQLPRIFEWKRVIAISPSFTKALRRDDALIDVASEQVTYFRAAAVVAAQEIAEQACVPSFLVDNALFLTYRKDAAFQGHSLPPMRCGSLWF